MALTVEASTDKEAYRPGEQVTVKAKVTDRAGRPVSGEMVVSVVDEAIPSRYASSTSTCSTSSTASSISTPTTSINTRPPPGTSTPSTRAETAARGTRQPGGLRQLPQELQGHRRLLSAAQRRERGRVGHLHAARQRHLLADHNDRDRRQPLRRVLQDEFRRDAALLRKAGHQPQIHRGRRGGRPRAGPRRRALRGG